MWRGTLLTLALAFMAGSGQAQESSEGEVWGLQYVGASCNPSRVVKVDLQDLVEMPERWQGQCVQVRGFNGHRSLFFDAADTRVHRHPSTDELDGRRLGLYGRQETMERLSDTPLGSRIEVTGKVSSCDELHAPNVVMLFGYCHYTDGPVLLMSDFEIVRLSTRPADD